MKRIALAFALAVLAASPLSATAPLDEAPRPKISTVQSAAAPSEAAPSLKLDRIEVAESSAGETAEAAQLGPRGSFWWVVGVIVVAGVILALVV